MSLLSLDSINPQFYEHKNAPSIHVCLCIQLGGNVATVSLDSRRHTIHFDIRIPCLLERLQLHAIGP